MANIHGREQGLFEGEGLLELAIGLNVGDGDVRRVTPSHLSVTKTGKRSVLGSVRVAHFE